jgi:hypothetical protein
MTKRLHHYVIRNLAGIELTSAAIAEITHLKHCVDYEYHGRYFYYFNTDEKYCVNEERAFDSYESLLAFIQQLNPDPQKTDIVDEPVVRGSDIPFRTIYIVRD